MKKHLTVLGIVAILLGITYIVGHAEDNTKPPASSMSPSTSSKAPAAASSFNKHLYSLSDPASLWVVVNKRQPLNPINYAPADLTSIGNGQTMRLAAAQQLQQLITAAKSAGYTIVPESGYRSYDYQVQIYGSEVRGFGQVKADTESARPGYSEHQTGWSVDLGSPGCYEDCFGSKPASQWLLANSYKYGFILRYPADKAGVTGYRNEPWHFRYVGISLATEMHNQHITTLEEFFGLPAAPDYKQ